MNFFRYVRVVQPVELEGASARVVEITDELPPAWRQGATSYGQWIS